MSNINKIKLEGEPTDYGLEAELHVYGTNDLQLNTQTYTFKNADNNKFGFVIPNGSDSAWVFYDTKWAQVSLNTTKTNAVLVNYFNSAVSSTAPINSLLSGLKTNNIVASTESMYISLGNNTANELTLKSPSVIKLAAASNIVDGNLTINSGNKTISPAFYKGSESANNALQTKADVDTKVANMVTSTSALTTDYIVVGNDNKTVKKSNTKVSDLALASTLANSIASLESEIITISDSMIHVVDSLPDITTATNKALYLVRGSDSPNLSKYIYKLYRCIKSVDGITDGFYLQPYNYISSPITTPSQLVDIDDGYYVSAYLYNEIFGLANQSSCSNIIKTGAYIKVITATFIATTSNSGTNWNITPLTVDSVPTSASNNLVKSGGVYSALSTLGANKQDTLVSGTSIKTINNTSLLGSGNISIVSASGLSVPSPVISVCRAKIDASGVSSLSSGLLCVGKSTYYSALVDAGYTLKLAFFRNIHHGHYRSGKVSTLVDGKETETTCYTNKTQWVESTGWNKATARSVNVTGTELVYNDLNDADVSLTAPGAYKKKICDMASLIDRFFYDRSTVQSLTTDTIHENIRATRSKVMWTDDAHTKWTYKYNFLEFAFCMRVYDDTGKLVGESGLSNSIYIAPSSEAVGRTGFKIEAK